MGKMIHTGPEEVMQCSCGEGGAASYFTYTKDDHQSDFGQPWMYVRCPKCNQRHSIDQLRALDDMTPEERNAMKERNMKWLKNTTKQ